jgi:uncharacterized membrane protein
MKTKTFNSITSVAMTLTLTAAMLSCIGIAITGFYPGIVVLLALVIVPIASKYYAKKNNNKPNALQSNFYTPLTIINLLTIFVVLWMAFVIVHDRVLQDCC